VRVASKAIDEIDLQKIEERYVDGGACSFYQVILVGVGAE